MSSKIVRPDIDTYQVPCFFYDQPGGRISERENLGIRLDLIFLDITPKPIGNLLWQEHYLGFSAALRVSDDSLSAFNIHGPEL